MTSTSFAALKASRDDNRREPRPPSYNGKLENAVVTVLCNRDANDWMPTTEVCGRLSQVRESPPTLQSVHAAVTRLVAKRRIQQRVVENSRMVRFDESSIAYDDFKAGRHFRERKMGLDRMTPGESFLTLATLLKQSGGAALLTVVDARDNDGEGTTAEYPLHLYVRDVAEENGIVRLWIPHARHVAALAAMSAKSGYILTASDLVGTQAYIRKEEGYKYPGRFTVTWELPPPPKAATIHDRVVAWWSRVVDWLTRRFNT